MPATSGTVMLGALPFLLGVQMLMQASQLDIAAEPREALCKDEPLADPVVDFAEERRAA